jgi:hypothetical protein
LWENIMFSVYRFVAVAVGAAITATVAVLATGVGWLVAVPMTTVGWIVLAVAQEHDERVVLEVDNDFQTALRGQADLVLARAGFTFNGAFGPCRARVDRSDTFLCEAVDVEGRGCIDLWIRRDRSDGGMNVSVDGRPLAELVASHGDLELGARVNRAVEPVGDVEALVAAFELVLPNRSR